MEIAQKRNSNRIRYVFEDDKLRYAIADGSGRREFSVRYDQISREMQSLEERSTWFRNAGALWLLLGLVLTTLDWSKFGRLDMSIWVPIGVICLSIYWLRVTRFLIFPSEQGNLLVIDNADGKRIVEELFRRRADYLRREYGVVRAGDTPDHLRGRLRWLHEEGALDERQLSERLEEVESLEARLQSATPLPPAGGVLH